MTRRDFIKTAIAAAVVAVVPMPARPAGPSLAEMIKACTAALNEQAIPIQERWIVLPGWALDAMGLPKSNDNGRCFYNSSFGEAWMMGPECGRVLDEQYIPAKALAGEPLNSRT